MTQNTSGTMKVYEALARAIATRGVDAIFGLIGDANLFMVDAWIRASHGRYVPVTHEASAVLMAIGYAQVSGGVGVATVTQGPGLTNTLTALIEGVKSSTPLVLLAGDTGVLDRDLLQNINQREFILATGAGFEQLRAPQTVVEDVATAFRRAESERRPVVLNMPWDLQWQETEYTPKRLVAVPRMGPAAHDSEFDNAIGIIAAARRPIVLGGRGATGARAALVRLGDRTGALLATTLRGKGLFRGHPFDLGLFGTLSTPIAVEAITESDCVIAFGAGLNRFTTYAQGLLQGKRVVQVDSDPSRVGRYGTPDAALVGDAALTAELIIHWLDEAEIEPSGFRSEQLRSSIASWKPEPRVTGIKVPQRPGTVDLRQALLMLNAEIQADRVVVTDTGRFMQSAWTLFDVPNPESYVHVVNFASIGLGLAAAIGAATAAGPRPTVLIAGDGGFMLGGLSEFTTAVRQNSDLIVILCNDGAYGAEHIQFRNKDMSPEISMFEWPDFAPIAKALGGDGVTVRGEADLDMAVQSIKTRKGPLLIDLKLDPEWVPPYSAP